MELEHTAGHNYENSETEPWLRSRDAGLIRVLAESLKFQKLDWFHQTRKTAPSAKN